MGTVFQVESTLVSCQQRMSGLEAGGLFALGRFRKGVLFHPLMGPISLDSHMATLTLDLLWPSVVWLTCSSLVDMCWGSLLTSCCSKTWDELCNDSDQQLVGGPQTLPRRSSFYFCPLNTTRVPYHEGVFRSEQ